MKRKHDFFLLAPVTVSLLMLVILFNPAMARNDPRENHHPAIYCSADSRVVAYLRTNQTMQFACINVANVRDDAKRQTHCPYAARHAKWVEQHNQQIPPTRQLMVESARSLQVVPVGSPVAADGDLSQRHLPMNVDSERSYVF